MAAPNHEVLAGHRVRHYVRVVDGHTTWRTLVLDVLRSGRPLVVEDVPSDCGWHHHLDGLPGSRHGRRVDQALLPQSVIQKLTTDLQSL